MEINKYLGLILLFCVTSVAYARQDEKGCIVKGWVKDTVSLKAIAYATVQVAEADAYELTTRAEAEAEANRKIAESLTEALIAYTYAENWNGELPTFMTGDGTTLPMFDMSALLNGTADNGTTAAQPAE